MASNGAARFQSPWQGGAYSQAPSPTQAPEYRPIGRPRNRQDESDAMVVPTREEFDAKLALVEARTETRFVELSGKMDRIVDSISSLGSQMTTELGNVKSELNAVRADNKNTRYTIIIAVVTSLIAGIAALWVTQGNMLASFSAGIVLRDSHQSPPAPLPKQN